MYISYEDCNVGKSLYGIEKASEEVNYNYIYQYDELYPGFQIAYSGKSVMLCNVFKKKSDAVEYLTEVSLTAPETYTCKVYVNPNGSGKTKDDLQLVKLRSGDTETIEKGYHTLEFSRPVEIVGDEFVVAIEITGIRDNLNILMEGKIPGIDLYNKAVTEEGKCFISTVDSYNWEDMGKFNEVNTSLIDGDSSIKAFTVLDYVDDSVESIEIETEPDVTVYSEGENFDKTGMVVVAYYSDGTTKTLSDSDYSIIDGTNLQLGQEYVTIKYADKEVRQEIEVVVSDKGEDDDPDNDLPVTANFKNAKCDVKSIQRYTYTEDSAYDDYTLMDVEINGITRSTDEETEFVYSYYISTDKNLKTIIDWVDIEEDQKDGNKLTFKIDSRDIKNYNELMQKQELYIYIQESAEKNGNQIVTLSPAIPLKTEGIAIDTFVDNVKQPNSSNQGENNNNNNNNGNNGDNGSNNGNGQNNNGGGSSSQTDKTGGTTGTTNGGEQVDGTLSPTNLPKTGAKIVIIAIVIILVTGIAVFIRYEVLNRYVK